MGFASRTINDVISIIDCDKYSFSFHQVGKNFNIFSFANYMDRSVVHCSIHSRILTNLERVILDLKKTKPFEDGGLYKYIVFSSLHPGGTTVLPLSLTLQAPASSDQVFYQDID